MSRRRRVETSASETESPATQTQSNTNTGERKMAGLTPEQIATLLGKTRTKGDYIVKLNQFIESGEQGVCANDNWMELKDKKSSTLKQGFENAKENKEAHEDAQFVKVLVSKENETDEDSKVYLINLKAAGIAADNETEPVAA